MATDHGLEMWAIRALHELGTIDAFENSNLDRLLQARDRAYESGALSLGATAELQLTGMHGYLFEADRARECGKRCVEIARTLGLEGVLLMALVQSALAEAVAGSRDEMEILLDEATTRSGERPEIQGTLAAGPSVSSTGPTMHECCTRSVGR